MHTQIYDINRTNTLGKTSAESKEKKKTSGELRRARSASATSSISKRSSWDDGRANHRAAQTQLFFFFFSGLGFSFPLSTCFWSFEFPAAAAAAAAAAWKTDGKLFYSRPNNDRSGCAWLLVFFLVFFVFYFSFKKKQQHWGEAGTRVANGAGFKLDVVCWKLNVLQTVNWSVCVLGEGGGAGGWGGG